MGHVVYFHPASLPNTLTKCTSFPDLPTKSLHKPVVLLINQHLMLPSAPGTGFPERSLLLWRHHDSGCLSRNTSHSYTPFSLTSLMRRSTSYLEIEASHFFKPVAKTLTVLYQSQNNYYFLYSLLHVKE